MTAHYITFAAQRPSAGTEQFDLTLAPERWMRSALCAETGGDDHFSEGKGHQYTEARKVCGACPVVAACGLYALRHRITEGMWGNMTPYERAQILRGSKR